MDRKIYPFIALAICLLISFKVVAIESVISKYPFTKNSVVSISVKDSNGKTLYQKNSQTLVHPASTLKVFTSMSALNTLGSNYKFKTAFYKNYENLYLKIGADALFSDKDMDKLLLGLSQYDLSGIKKIYIDDTIIDKESYGTGWQHDDNASRFVPQISPYVINRNLFILKLSVKNNIVTPTCNCYNERIINNLKVGEKNNYTVSRDLFKEFQPLILSGTINSSAAISVPAINPQKLYFNILYSYAKKYNVNLNIPKTFQKMPQNLQELVSVEHSISDILKRVNSNSDNMAAEILFKTAGGKNTNSGSTNNAIKMFKNFYSTLGISTKDIIVVDASGLSTNDYLTSDWITTSLLAIKKNKNFPVLYNSMTDNSYGTFADRLGKNSPVKLKVKTGTLANTSSVIGYIQTKNGNNVVFSIILDNLPANNNAKLLENEIINKIYSNY